MGDLDCPQTRREAIEQMKLAPLRIAQGAVAIKDDAQGRLHGHEGDLADECAEDAIGGAGVAVGGIEGVAYEAAVTGVIRKVAREIGDLALEATHGGRREWDLRGDSGIGDGEAGGEIVAAVEDEGGRLEQRGGVFWGDACDVRGDF